MLEPLDPKAVTQSIYPSELLQKLVVLPYNLAKNPNFEGLKLCVIPVLIEGTKCKQSFDLLVDTGSQISLPQVLVQQKF